MKKVNLVFAFSLVLLLFPYWETVTIDKSKIVGNYPFAGDMVFKDNPNDRVFVSTEISCDYWLEKDKQPEKQVIQTMRIGVLGFLGIGMAKVIN